MLLSWHKPVIRLWTAARATEKKKLHVNSHFRSPHNGREVKKKSHSRIKKEEAVDDKKWASDKKLLHHDELATLITFREMAIFMMTIVPCLHGLSGFRDKKEVFVMMLWVSVLSLRDDKVFGVRAGGDRYQVLNVCPGQLFFPLAEGPRIEHKNEFSRGHQKKEVPSQREKQRKAFRNVYNRLTRSLYGFIIAHRKKKSSQHNICALGKVWSRLFLLSQQYQTKKNGEQQQNMPFNQK